MATPPVEGSRLMRRSLQAEMELVAHGHGEKLSRIAVRQCREYALGWAQHVRPSLQEEVALDLFEWRLREVERDWIHGEERFLGRVPPDGRRRRGEFDPR